MAWIEAANRRGLIGYVVAAERVRCPSNPDRGIAFQEAVRFRTDWDIKDAVRDLASSPMEDRAVKVFSRSNEVGDDVLLIAADKHYRDRQTQGNDQVVYRLTRGDVSQTSVHEELEESESVSWKDVEYDSDSGSESVMSGWSL